MGKRRRESTKGEGTGETSDSDVGEHSRLTATAKRARLESEEIRREPRPTMEEEVQQEREKLQLLVSAFSNAQQDQYEIFRRSTFPKASIRKLMQNMCGGTVPQNAVIAMAGITKVFVGEVVEEACIARDKMKDEGPLQPKHVREAVRVLKTRDKMPNSKYKKVSSLS